MLHRCYFVRTNYLIENRNRIFLVSAMWLVTMSPVPQTHTIQLYQCCCQTGPTHRYQLPIHHQPIWNENEMCQYHQPQHTNFPRLMVLLLQNEFKNVFNVGNVNEFRLWSMNWLNWFWIWGSTTQAPKVPAIQDDADGHLIYHTGDILHNRCSW